MSADAKKEYKSAYCGLCRVLAKRYGAKARFLVSFDTTFLLTVLSAISEEIKCENCRCPYHFGRKRLCMTGTASEYAADVTVLLACLKFDDDIKDDKSIKAKIFKKLFEKEYKKATENQKKLHGKLVSLLSELELEEKKGQQDANVPAGIFGNILSEVFSQNEALRQFGFYLGRFIYLCDAVCDFKKDLKRKRYNPLTCYRLSDVENMLVFNIDKCIECIEDIGLQNEVINNVLRYGAWLRYSIKHKRETI